MKTSRRNPGATIQTLSLVGKQKLVLERRPGQNVLQIISSEGQVTLTVQITPAGPVLRFEGSGLMIQTAGALAIDAECVAIHGREGLALTSGGDAKISVAGDLDTEARIQNITAFLGNVNVKANDDVKLNGERVMMNC